MALVGFDVSSFTYEAVVRWEHGGMRRYTRPSVDSMEFRDDEGNVIDYGNRWVSQDETPPEDSYSIVDHPDRFAPLHTVATALIEYLVSAYDVDIQEGRHVTDDLLHPPAADNIVRAVCLTPPNEVCAPVVIVLTDFPAVHLYGGVLFSQVYPSCACNACDERWEDAAGEFEWDTFAIVDGDFTEEVSESRRAGWSYDRGRGFVKRMGQTVSYRLQTRDGKSEQSGQSRAEDVPSTLLKNARGKLAALAVANPGGNWLPWPT